MEIFLNKIKYYFLTCNETRREHMYKEFDHLNIKEINPIPVSTGISKQQSGASGFCRMIQNAIDDQDTQIPFQPFVLLEDDVKMYREFPESVYIPQNTDILYIGLSNWGIDQNDIGQPDLACYTKLTDAQVHKQCKHAHKGCRCSSCRRTTAEHAGRRTTAEPAGRHTTGCSTRSEAGLYTFSKNI